MGHSTVRFLNLKKLIDECRDEYNEAISRVIDSTSFIGGAEVERFEKAFSEYLGPGNYCVGMANGTDAITLAAKALRIPAGAEAIVPAMTYVATAAALVQAGLKIKLVDVEPGTWVVDPSVVEKGIGPQTALLVPVHLYGRMAAMDRFRALADQRNLKLMEDAAQAQGALWMGKPPAFWGDIATYSFYPGKNLGAWGDAGGVVTRSEALALYCRALGNQGGIKKYEHDYIGYNSRLDSLQAAVLSVKLKYLDRQNQARNDIASAYREMLAGVPGLELPAETPNGRHCYHQFVVLVEERERFAEHMRSKSIETGIHYPKAIHQLPAFKHYDFAQQSFPNAERLARHGLSLPICPTLTVSEVERVARAAREFFG